MSEPATATDPDTRVLLALRLRSFAPAEAIASAAELPLEQVTAQLGAFAARDLVKYRDGRLTGWLLTPAGRAEGQRRLDEELRSLTEADQERLRAGYEAFLLHNQPMLELCTDWQLLGGASSQELNDHSDAAYDAAVVKRLHLLDSEVQPICTQLGAVLDRLAGYGARFTAAVAKVDAGEIDYFTKPMIDSYHTVWFELHEHLLATLGIERGEGT